MARKILVTSGKGGVGKTTVAANLGYFLAEHNKKVVLVDLDVSLNNLDVVLQVENQVVYDITDVATGHARVQQALIRHGQNPLLSILPAAQGFSQSLLTKEKLKQIIAVLDENFDYIFLDCPAGIDDGFHKGASVADEAILIATPHISAIRDADKALRLLATYNIAPIGLVLNRVRGDLIKSGEMMSPKTVGTLIKCPLLGVVPESDFLGTEGLAFLRRGDAQDAFKILAQNVHQGKNDLFDAERKYNGVTGFLRRRFGKK